MKYKPLSYVNSFIPKTIREAADDPKQFESWALQALRTVNFQQRYEHDLCLLYVDNHSARLPKGLKRITTIREISDPNTLLTVEQTLRNILYESTGDVGALGEEELQDENNVQVSYNTELLINYQIMFNSLVTNYARPLKYVGTTSSNYFSKKCYYQLIRCNDCVEHFSITHDGCIKTSFKTGYVCMEFIKEPMDENCDFVAPEQPVQLWNAMANYALAQYWLERDALGEQGANQRFVRHQRMYSNYINEAKGIMALQNIDLNLHTALQYRDQAILRFPKVFNE